jgi:hypothetical protein
MKRTPIAPGRPAQKAPAAPALLLLRVTPNETHQVSRRRGLNYANPEKQRGNVLRYELG